ncbi:neurotrophin 1 [Lepeophtheirus salmonis]|uniref:Spaetzle domain-containing protein n=2 Tax=Lepeophtheirus salmonis TaxID=72036 RepID=A0A0K2V1Z8_LEPSM|nr:classical arabinogalactan protein 9-like [Lepeophtheirus salmonis]
MALKCMVLATLIAAVYGATPAPYGYTPAPVYGYSPSPAPYHEPSPYHEPAPYSPYHEPAPYAPPHHEPAPYAPPHHEPAPYAPPHHEPAPYAPPHHPSPAPYAPPHHNQPEHYAPPKCSKGNPNTYCVEDSEYPTYEIEHALEYHYDAVQQIYKDVLANTENSVDRLKSLVEETYLCPSETKYIQPLRAVNANGKWRIIVNNVKAHYETLTQTTRVEHCSTPGSHCPLVPECYETKCVQKSIYHRFLTYDPYDQYLPFAIESFKLPASCACYNGAFAESH